MTLLHTITDGALAAAELLALLLVPPASAAQPTSAEHAAALDRPVVLHRLSTAIDVRLLGSLADVRVTQHVRNDGSTAADLARVLPAVDAEADTIRIVRGAHAVDLLGASDCDEAPTVGHARLSHDEAIADALQLAPGADAIVELARAQVLVRDGRSYRVALPVRFDADAPRATLVEQDDAWFLVVVPHRSAPRATLVLRPEYGAADTLALGRADPAVAMIVPLADRAQFDDLAAGVIELEFAGGGTSFWSTVVPERVDERASVQAGAAE